jgi:hypothetical protein
MAAGDHDPVGLEQFEPVAVEILVGDRVPSELVSVEPVDDHQVGGELPWRVGHEPAAVARTHVDDRPPPRAEHDARSIRVRLVAGVPEVVVPLQVEIIRLQYRDMSDQYFGPWNIQRQPVVCVREIGAGRK